MSNVIPITRIKGVKKSCNNCPLEKAFLEYIRQEKKNLLNLIAIKPKSPPTSV